MQSMRFPLDSGSGVVGCGPSGWSGNVPGVSQMAGVQEVRNRDGSISFRVRFERAGFERSRGSRTFRVPAGATKTRAREVRREAEAFAAEVERAGGVEAYDAGRLTVAELAERFLAARAEPVSAATRAKYETVIRVHILPVMGARPISKVGALDVEGWLAGQRSAGDAAASVRGRWTVLRMLFRQAVKWRLLAWNPCDGVQAPRGGRGRERVLTRGEEAKLAAAMRGDPYEALWRVLLYAGLRIGEAVALRWMDVEGDRLQVRRTATHDGGSAIREGTKTRRDRVVILDGETVAAFARLRGSRAVFPAALVFAGPRTEWLRPGQAARRLVALCREAGIPDDITPHVLRHSHITKLRKAGIPYSVIARRVGHASLATTLGYDHPDEDDDRRAADAAVGKWDAAGTADHPGGEVRALGSDA